MAIDLRTAQSAAAMQIVLLADACPAATSASSSRFQAVCVCLKGVPRTDMHAVLIVTAGAHVAISRTQTRESSRAQLIVPDLPAQMAVAPSIKFA
jgi:hypothetical protein